MNQVEIDAMQKVLPVEKRMVGGEMEMCVLLDAVVKHYRYQTVDSLCEAYHTNLINDISMVRCGEATWMPIRFAWRVMTGVLETEALQYATVILKKENKLSQSAVLEYLKSFDETHEVAE